jgi:Flp pilus assembly protein TadG
VIRAPSRIGADRSGLALVEFAFTFPVLLILFLGGYQLSDAIACKRKVGITNRTLVDLATRNKQITVAEVEAVLSAAVQVMSPYRAAQAQLRLTEVYTNATGATTVVWSRGRNTTGRAAGSAISLPGTLRTNGNYLLLSEITYAYDPRASFGFLGRQNLSDSLFMSPRNSSSVPCNDC